MQQLEGVPQFISKSNRKNNRNLDLLLWRVETRQSSATNARYFKKQKSRHWFHMYIKARFYRNGLNFIFCQAFWSVCIPFFKRQKWIPLVLKLVSYIQGLRRVVSYHCLEKSRIYHQALHLVFGHDMPTTSKHDKFSFIHVSLDNFPNFSLATFSWFQCSPYALVFRWRIRQASKTTKLFQPPSYLS